jgi:hypothetical protein
MQVIHACFRLVTLPCSKAGNMQWLQTKLKSSIDLVIIVPMQYTCFVNKPVKKSFFINTSPIYSTLCLTVKVKLQVANSISDDQKLMGT